MPIRHDRNYQFNRQSAERVIDVVKRVETMFYEQRQWIPELAVNTSSDQLVEAIVTTAITACSSTTYGTGAAQPYIQSTAAPGTGISDPGYANPVTVLNWLTSTGTISIGTHVMISMRSGYWLLVSGDC
jgi:hypothetical protein